MTSRVRVAVDPSPHLRCVDPPASDRVGAGVNSSTKSSKRSEDHGLDGRTVWCGRSVPVCRERKSWFLVQGKVKFFDQNRGFGFISREGGEDVFVHVSNLQAEGATLAEGQTVEFEVGPGRKSEEAKNVRAV